MSHSTCTHQGRVNSRLLVVGSQTASLTPDLSFDHNLCCRCSNGSCEAILDIYTSRPFQRYKEHLKARCFDPCNSALSFRESRRTPSFHFWECESHLHTSLKVGLRQWWLMQRKDFTTINTWYMFFFPLSYRFLVVYINKRTISFINVLTWCDQQKTLMALL